MIEIQNSSGKSLIDDKDFQSATYPAQEGDSSAADKLEKEDILSLSRDAVMQTHFARNQCFQFEITLEYDKHKKEIKASPMAEDWFNDIPKHFETALEELKDEQCFLLERYGKIHSHSGHVVFQSDSDSQQEQYPQCEINRIKFLLQRLFKVLESLLLCSKEYTEILSVTEKKLKGNSTAAEFTVEDYQKILQENKRKGEEIEELFFEDRLLLGPIVVNVEKLKK